MNVDEAFDKFYSGYPRKVSKRTARVAFAAALKRGSFETIMRRLDYVMTHEWNGRGVEHIPYPATFLRSEDFDDEVECQEDDHEAPPPLIRLIDVNERAYGRAKALRAVEQQNLTTWEEGARLHRHDQHCQMGRVCIYSEQKKPVIPSVDELIERMRK